MPNYLLKQDSDRLLLENGDKIILDENVTVDLNTPLDAATISDTTPDLEFTGIDTQAHSIDYQIQIDEQSIFLPVIRDRVTQGGASTTSTVSISHTVSSGNNRLLVVGIMSRGGSMSSVTYGGVALTKLNQLLDRPDDNSAFGISWWFLTAPTVGTANVVITRTFNTNTQGVQAVIASYFNVNQTNPFYYHHIENKGNVSTLSTTITSLEGSMVLDMIGLPDNGTGIAPYPTSADQVLLAVSDTVVDNRMASSEKVGDDNVTMSWTVRTEIVMHGLVTFNPVFIPILDRRSDLHTGFLNTVTPADTSPFNSGEKIAYTVDPNAILSVNTSNYQATGSYGTGTVTAQKRAQRFTPATTSDLAAVSLRLARNTTNIPTDHAKVSIFTDNAGEPGTLLETANTIPGSTMNAIAGEQMGLTYTFYFSGSTILTAGTYYWIVLDRTGSYGADNYVWKGSGSVAYETVRIFNGTTWATSGAVSQWFEVLYGTALTAGTYYWRVRGKDPSGLNKYGYWSEVRSFIISSGGVYTQTLTETITLTEVFLRLPTRFLNETIPIIDTVSKRPNRLLNESVSINDTLLKNATKLLNEVISVADTFTRAFTRVLTDPITIVDTINKYSSRLLSEIVSITDMFAKIPGRILSEVVTVTDELITFLEKIFTESISLTDSIVKSSIRIFSETILLVDSIIRNPARLLQETISIIDSFERVMAKNLTEVITLTEEFIRSVSRMISESITVSDTVLKDIGRAMALEIISISDSFERAQNRILTEVISIGDIIERSMNRVFAEVLTISDVFINISQLIFEEIINITDTITRNIGTIFSETISIVETFMKNTYKTFIENLSIGEVFGMVISKIFSEIITLTDTIEKVFNRITAGIPGLIQGAIRGIQAFIPEGMISHRDKGNMMVSERDKPTGMVRDNDKPTGMIISRDKPEKV